MDRRRNGRHHLQLADKTAGSIPVFTGPGTVEAEYYIKGEEGYKDSEIRKKMAVIYEEERQIPEALLRLQSACGCCTMKKGIRAPEGDDPEQYS